MSEIAGYPGSPSHLQWPRSKLRCTNEPKHLRSRSYHAAKADEDGQHSGGSKCATMHGCSPFLSASRPRLDGPLDYQPRKAVSHSRRRRLRTFKRQWLPECCLQRSSSNSSASPTRISRRARCASLLKLCRHSQAKPSTTPRNDNDALGSPAGKEG